MKPAERDLGRACKDKTTAPPLSYLLELIGSSGLSVMADVGLSNGETNCKFADVE